MSWSWLSARPLKSSERYEEAGISFHFQDRIWFSNDLFVFNLTHQIEDGWWMGVKNGKVGAFPSNFVSEIFLPPKGWWSNSIFSFYFLPFLVPSNCICLYSDRSEARWRQVETQTVRCNVHQGGMCCTNSQTCQDVLPLTLPLLNRCINRCPGNQVWETRQKLVSFLSHLMVWLFFSFCLNHDILSVSLKPAGRVSLCILAVHSRLLNFYVTLKAWHANVRSSLIIAQDQG